jgi:hypothetical protein
VNLEGRRWGEGGDGDGGTWWPEMEMEAPGGGGW